MTPTIARVTLSQLSPKTCAMSDLQAALGDAASSDHFYAPCSHDGEAEIRYVAPPRSADAQCEHVQTVFQKRKLHTWAEQGVFLLNTPCYVVVGSGVVLLEDGRVIEDTIYPSTGDSGIERRFGPGIREANLETRLREAPFLGEGLWSPLFSRWANVYFHAITESLTQDALFARSGFAEAMRFIAPAKTAGAQNLVLAQASGKVERSEALIVKVPRLLLSTLLYKHSVMGPDFRAFVAQAKTRLFGADHARPGAGHEKVYVSRVGATARRMTNEAELADALQQRGFHIFQAEAFPFEEQARVFKDARVVVGGHGAGLTNAAFARPDCILCELRPLNRANQSPFWGASYQKLSAIMGYGYATHVSPNPADSDEWAANIPEILDLVERIAA